MPFDLNLKELPKVLIRGARERIGIRAGDEDHADLDGNGFGIDARRSHEATSFAHLLDCHLVSLEGPLQGVPRAGFAQDVQGVQQEVPPMRAHERTGSDQDEIRVQRAEVGLRSMRPTRFMGVGFGSSTSGAPWVCPWSTKMFTV